MTPHIPTGTNAKRQDSKTMPIPHKVLGNKKVFDITDQFRMAASGMICFHLSFF